MCSGLTVRSFSGSKRLHRLLWERKALYKSSGRPRLALTTIIYPSSIFHSSLSRLCIVFTMQILVAALTLLAAASAAAIDKQTLSSACKSYVDGFDELVLDPVPVLSRVGTYHGLNYSGFGLLVSSPVNLGGSP